MHEIMYASKYNYFYSITMVNSRKENHCSENQCINYICTYIHILYITQSCKRMYSALEARIIKFYRVRMQVRSSIPVTSCLYITQKLDTCICRIVHWHWRSKYNTTVTLSICGCLTLNTPLSAPLANAIHLTYGWRQCVHFFDYILTHTPL